MKKGFTLIEVLVVVLIIGILTSVALPHYQKAVEKSRMSEAVSLLRVIANANFVYYTTYGRYAKEDEIEKLDISIPGKKARITDNETRIETKNFVYSPTGQGLDKGIALAQRVPYPTYYIYINSDTPERIRCMTYASASGIQKKLCITLNEKGSL